MPTCRDVDHSSAPCCAAAAYFYALELDGPALAWEFLRRHADYRAEWQASAGRTMGADPIRWGLRCRP
ncbi:transcriptional regulator domain-containing protein [Acidovorax sp. NCPPB 4044]|uniref:transcriptional regulator domain-containing protein n=1 Tax=Acidovorax sp. NCPPB 4044 TaxID=2940490 RepID=UPI00230257B7|nr:DUF6499 domain-containing protein [Acidovorax sp. NCPPB 4044]MDA8520136.1 DUF6499 domain-containing protein [Acidovorax sp. NCPPB 4044]